MLDIFKAKKPTKFEVMQQIIQDAESYARNCQIHVATALLTCLIDESVRLREEIKKNG